MEASRRARRRRGHSRKCLQTEVVLPSLVLPRVKRKEQDPDPPPGAGGSRSSNRKRARLSSNLSCTLLVSHLHVATTSDHLRAFFENFGDVSAARVVSHHQQHGYGYVVFEAQEVADGVIAAASSKDGIRIGSRKIRVTRSWGPLPEIFASVQKPQLRMERKGHQWSTPRCRSRLFLSAVASAVASASPEPFVPVRPIIEDTPLGNRKVISYDDWL